MQQVRADAYRGDHGLIVLLTCICVALLIVTAFGIIGLTSYWVAQRRQQIGIRRALGATRQAIVRYFQTENFMIAAAGAVVGIAFAIALNLWMVRSFEMVRMDNSRAIAGAADHPAAGAIRGAVAGAARGVHSPGLGDARRLRRVRCDSAPHPLTCPHAYGTRYR